MLYYFLLYSIGKAILRITTEQTEVPIMTIMQIMPSTMIMEVRATASQTVSSINQYTLTFLFTQVLFFFNLNFSLKDTTTDSMTHDTGDTMITPTGLIMTAETATIINTCTLLGMQRKYYAVTGIFGDGCNFIMAYIRNCSCSFAKCGAV